MAAPFLMVYLKDLATDFAVFVAFFTNDIVLEVTDWIDGEDRDE